MNLSFWKPLFKGQLHSGGTKFGPLLKGHLYSGERGHFFLVPKLGFNFHSGVTWALKKWLTTKIIDMFKCTRVTITTAFKTWTISLTLMYCTCGNSTQRQWSRCFIHYLAAWDNDCSRFWLRIKEKSFHSWLITNPRLTSIQGTPLLRDICLGPEGVPCRGSNVRQSLEKEKGGHCILLGTENWWSGQFLVNKLCYPWGPPAILSCL